MLINTFNNTSLVNLNFSMNQSIEKNYDVYENYLLNLNDLGISERDKSISFLFNIGIKNIVDNVLFNITGQNSYATLIESRAYSEAEEVFQYSLDEVLTSVKFWGYRTTLSENICDVNSFFPLKDQLKLNTSNYHMALSYEKSYSDLKINGVNLSDGLKLFLITGETYKSKDLYKCVSEIPHNLDDTSLITLFSSGDTIGIISIYDVQDKYTFYISKDYILNNGISFKKNILGLDVEYFLESCIENKVVNSHLELQYDDNLLYDKGTHIKDCLLNVPNSFSEAILFFKKNNNINLNQIQYGLDTYMDVDFSNKNKVNNSNSFSLQINKDNPLRIVEYDQRSQVYSTISEIYHIFNTVNREDNGFYESYYYKPYYVIPLRTLTPVKVTSENIDRNGYYENGRLFYKNVNNNRLSNLYPFLNQKHIVEVDYSFYLYRQDLYNIYEKGNTYNFIHELPENYNLVESLTC